MPSKISFTWRFPIAPWTFSNHPGIKLGLLGIRQTEFLHGRPVEQYLKPAGLFVYMEIPYRAMDFFHIRTVHGGTLSVETEQPGRLYTASSSTNGHS